jgi:hypothetical protein
MEEEEMSLIPQGAEVTKGAIADYWINDGILVALSKSIRRTVPLIRENATLVKAITGNKKMPLLIYLSNSPVPDKATRRLSTEMLPEIYSAMAMVSEPGLSFFIMKILFALKPPPIPMKSFTNDKDAKEWLKQFVVKR